MYAELQRLNANSHNGVNFRDVMCHFVIGSDEANLLASGGGVVVRVLGDKEKKKTRNSAERFPCIDNYFTNRCMRRRDRAKYFFDEWREDSNWLH